MMPLILTAEMRARLDVALARGLGWEQLLRSACEMLCRTSAQLMSAVTACGRLNAGDEELLQLLAQAEELATEYGLASDVRLDGTAFSVTFTRNGGAVRAAREDR